MSRGKAVALVAAALVAGVVLGSFGIASAAAPATATGTSGACGAGIGAQMRDAGGRLVDVVAKLTGLKVEDVQAKRQAGEPFTKIASDKGVSAEKVVSSALEIRKSALDAAVKDGRITQEQADAAYARMQTRLTDRVSSTDACNGGGGGGCGMGGAGRGRGAGGGCGAGGGACGGVAPAR